MKNVAKKDDHILPAIVKAVNDDGTIDVSFDDLLIKGCRIKSITGYDKGITVKPSIESVVLIERIGDTEQFFVIMYSAIDEHIVDTGNMVYKVNEDGHLVTNGEDTLKEVLTLIVEAVQPIVVIYGNNPDYEKLTQALTKINNLLQ